jgi:predicted membrane protein
MEINSYILATVLIMIGLGFILRKFIFRPMKKHSRMAFNSSDTLNEDMLDEVNVFSGSKSEILSKNFQGGKIINVFGGSHIDFSNANLAEGKNLIEVVCVLGGVEIIVPAHWHVVLDVKGVLGAFEIKGNRGNVEIDHSKQLFIQGIAVLGGGEVKISRY